MALKLTLPTVAKAADPDIEVRGVYVEEWVESLPYADPLTLARQLVEAVAKLNRNPTKATTRLALMELYAVPYVFLLERQRAHGLSTTASSFERRRTNAQIARRIAIEMAYGYKLVLAHSMAKRSLFSRKRDAVLPIQRAMLFLSCAIVHSYEEYVSAPKNCWSELAELYRHASDTELRDQSPSDSPLGESFNLSPDQTYKRALLTSLIDPNHLGEGEIWRVWTLLEHRADAAAWATAGDELKHTGRFVVNLTGDRKPISYSLAGVQKIQGSTLLLDANPVIAGIQNDLKQSTVPIADKMLLSRVVRCLGLPPKRHSPRESMVGKVAISSGIATIHHFLDNAATPQRRPSEADEGIEIGDTQTDLALAGPSYTREDWELVDRGPAGVGIFRCARPAVDVRVGEILGLEFLARASEPGLRVAVVRWLSIADETEYHVGAQILSPSGQAVTVTDPDDDEKRRGGLALPRLSKDQGCTLLVPKGFYKKGKQLVVNAKGASLTITVNVLVEGSDSFERFNFHVV